MAGLDQERVEKEVFKLGREVFEDISSPSHSIFNPQYYIDLIMSWAMDDPEVKVSLFRFVDALANLRESESIVRHAKEYLGHLGDRLPGFIDKALKIPENSVAAKFGAQVVKKKIRFLARRFIVGESAQDALPVLRKIRASRTAFTVDLLGESTMSEVEAEDYRLRYLDLINVLGEQVPGWIEADPIIPGHRGEATPVNVSVKLSALYSQSGALNAKRTIGILTERLCSILEEAKRRNAFVYVDMEDTPLTDITIKTFIAAAEDPRFKDSDRIGLVLQAYLRRTENDLLELAKWVKKRATPISVRLVKGAYWDTESMLARQKDWPVPVWEKKRSTDANYEKLSLILLDNAELIMPAFASHNIRSLAHAVVCAEMKGLDRTRFEIQTLYGMGQPIKAAFAARGFLVREYAPVGDLLPGMGYLVRRLLENTSNEGFIRKSFHEGVDPMELLKRPDFAADDDGVSHLIHSGDSAFYNSPPVDFADPDARFALEAEVQARLDSRPATVRPIIGGQEVPCEKTMRRMAPEAPKKITVAEVWLADRAAAERAIADVASYFPVWRDTAPTERAEVLKRTAGILENRRKLLTALIVVEAGKPWSEADGDVAEAIDFLNYYADQAVKLFHGQELPSPAGELNRYLYEPRGVTAVIGPWNFPLAIPCGMFSAALVTGNTAILKPAEQSSAIACELFRAFLDAGLPAHAAAFLPGLGEEIGRLLVSHPRVSTIAFTGSKQVGLSIIKSAGAVPAGCEHVKRTIIEMGGKNAIIIDDDADLDEAVKGVLVSAFGYQGQKCSACSRAIVVGNAYDRFVERLSQGVESIITGPASDPGTFVGPVIDEESYNRINQTIDSARRDCKLLAEGPAFDDPSGGYYVRPAVFGDIPAGHPLLTQEIFGPVLAVMRAKDIKQAVSLALDSEFGLTGSIFSRSPSNIEYAAREFRVGNLYINRASTGALVGRQPFGGAKMSGVGSKAGGPDYLLQFVIPRTITENTVRRGFVPEGS